MSSATAPPAPTPASPASGAAPLIIRPRPGWRPVDLAELWHYRELLWFLAARDVKVRYKQTVLGAAWAVIQPLLTMVVFSLLFELLMGRGGKPTVPGVPYSVSTFAALLPWQLFANAMGNAGNSLVANQNLITKVYFPRLIVPLSAVLAGLVDFAVAFGVLVVMMACFGIMPSWEVVFLPAFILLAVLSALAAGLWLSALNAIYRDFRYTIPFLIQAGMFVSPVIYTSQSVLAKLPKWAQVIYGLNPMASVIEGFRWALLPDAPFPPPLLMAVSTVMVVLLVIGGLFYFRRMERSFADVV
jgi:lipopolysaccharide transport system permease protein